MSSNQRAPTAPGRPALWPIRRRSRESEGAATADKMLDLYPSPQIIPFNLRRSLTQHLRLDSSSHQPTVQKGLFCRRGDLLLRQTNPGQPALFFFFLWDLIKQTNKQANKRRLCDTRTGSHDSAGRRFAQNDETEPAPELPERRLLSGR